MQTFLSPNCYYTDSISYPHEKHYLLSFCQGSRRPSQLLSAQLLPMPDDPVPPRLPPIPDLPQLSLPPPRQLLPPWDLYNTSYFIWNVQFKEKIQFANSYVCSREMLNETLSVLSLKVTLRGHYWVAVCLTCSCHCCVANCYPHCPDNLHCQSCLGCSHSSTGHPHVPANIQRVTLISAKINNNHTCHVLLSNQPWQTEHFMLTSMINTTQCFKTKPCIHLYVNTINTPAWTVCFPPDVYGAPPPVVWIWEPVPPPVYAVSLPLFSGAPPTLSGVLHSLTWSSGSFLLSDVVLSNKHWELMEIY